MTIGHIGILGSGMIGAGVARLAADAGLKVTISNSRGPESLIDLVYELGDRAVADTVTNLIANCDTIVVAVPLAAWKALPGKAFAGKTLLDATNYYPDRFGKIDELDASGLTSSEFLQQAWPAAALVKTLNTVDYVRLPRLAVKTAGSVRTALPVAGDSADARNRATAFLDAIGFDTVDLGELRHGWRFEPGTPTHVAPYSREKEPFSDDPYTRFLEAETVPVPTEDALRLLNAATRE
ncbi:hypothetical protein CH296_26515 [Rhodococcus sp. 14-2496-1d]|nr:hypothetical protein CH296_26515 [Rhodococcus sp. 14-2496-1d]